MAAIALETLNAATPADFTAALGDLFEHSPWIAEAVAPHRPFASLAALHAAMMTVVREAAHEQRLALIRAHPDLAGKAARGGTMTLDSVAEQSSAGLDQLSDEEYATFTRLNDAYRGRFGIPFILCVRRHTKDSILRQFERRLANSPEAEIEAAIAEIGRITALRLDQRVTAPDRLPVHGRLSTHVLDTHSGRPAAGVAIDLVEIAASGRHRLIARAVTNADGRTDGPLIGGRPVPIGRYELRFAVAPYFAAAGVPLADPPFLDTVPVAFAVAEPEGHYHVPLLVTPWSYATYRGS